MKKDKIRNWVIILISIAAGLGLSWQGITLNIDKLKLPSSGILTNGFAAGMFLFHGIWLAVFIANVFIAMINIYLSVVEKSPKIRESTGFIIFISAVSMGLFLNNSFENYRLLSLILTFAVPVLIAVAEIVLSIIAFSRKESTAGFIHLSQVFLTGTWVFFIIQAMTLYFGV